MDSISAMARGIANKEKPRMVFDWDKAASLIQERGIRNAGAGLAQDFEWTAGRILRDSEPVTTDYLYLASTWATPQLIVQDEEGCEVETIDCYIYESDVPPEWLEGSIEKDFAHIKWPASALTALSAK